MDDEVELVSDGDGVAVIGKPGAVERFLSGEGLSSVELPRLSEALRGSSVAADAATHLAENSGRWVKLTKESAAAIGKHGLTPTKTPGIQHAMIGKPGHIKQWIQIAKGPTTLAAAPVLLPMAAAMMTQMAMQRQMDEINDYLVVIDQKLDDVMRAQTNQVLARLDGIDLAIREAMSVRDSVGRVSEVTWSKVQSASTAIHETQGYALRQLSDLTDKLERQKKVDDLVKIAKDTEAQVLKWLSVLARCYQLSEAVAVLELDRVLDASPDELDRHRLGLQAARADRLDSIESATSTLLSRMAVAVKKANSQVLFNPIQSPQIVEASNRVADGVEEFHDALGIDSDHQSATATRWREAAADTLGKAVEAGGDGLDTVKDLGKKTRDQALSVKAKLADKRAERKQRRDAKGAETAEASED